MEKTVNEAFIKFSGKVPFPLHLELGQDVSVVVHNYTTEVPLNYIYNVVKSEDGDNQDGSVDRTFTLKSTSE